MYPEEPITVEVKLDSDRWWVWLADKRLIGFKDKRCARDVAMNITDALKAKGITTDESIDGAVTPLHRKGEG